MINNYIYVIPLLVNLFFFLYFYFYKFRRKNKLEKEIREELKEKLSEEKKLKEEELKEEIKLLEKEFEEKQNFYNDLIRKNELIIEREKITRQLVIDGKEAIIQKELEQYEEKEKNRIEREFLNKRNDLKEELRKKIESLEEENKKLDKILEENKIKINEKIEEAQNELDDYYKKRLVVNEAILREKQIQEQEEFFKVNIYENDIEDISILKEIEPRLRNKEALNRLVYDVFIKKPSMEMIKRVLSGGAPSGIYKITYTPTGESYIGKSTNISKRWSEHIKSSFNLGTIAHSSLHTKMGRDGVWNFSFELLEEVEKDKLSEREKFWISFYETKKYGLNEREG